MSPALLEVRGLQVGIRQQGAALPVVRDVSFALSRGETLAMVGESGCGKSMTSLALTRLLPHGADISGGTALLGGEDIFGMDEPQIRRIRGRRIGMIFQEPMTSLNPVYRIGAQIVEAILCHEQVSRKAAMARAVELLERVYIPDSRRSARAYPHQLSGGMRQRAMIAMALCCRPEVLIADEPTTALDATVQAQILALLDELRREFDMAVLFISHDLGVVAQIADRVMIMYRGEIVESGTTEEILHRPLHPYTGELLACAPRIGVLRDTLPSIPGQLPALHDTLSGCAFNPRCERTSAQCRQTQPQLTGDRRLVRCYHPLTAAPHPVSEHAAARS